MKTSEMLRKAYPFLWDGVEDTVLKSEYICYAIERAFAAELGGDVIEEIHVKGIGREILECQKKIVEKMNEWFNPRLRRECMSFETAMFELGVKQELAGNTEWRQLRRREFLTNLISHYERLGD